MIDYFQVENWLIPSKCIRLKIVLLYLLKYLHSISQTFEFEIHSIFLTVSVK